MEITLFSNMDIFFYWQSPTGLITGMAQGSTSLLSNTVYAISDAATQFSKAAQKVSLLLINS